MDPLPVEPTTIEYQTPEPNNWRFMVRLMAAIAVVRGFTSAIQSASLLARRSSFNSLFPARLVVESIFIIFLGVGFIGSGLLCWRGHRLGPRIMVWTSVAFTVVVLVNIAQQTVQRHTLDVFWFLVPYWCNVLDGLVVPMALLFFFRRPEVKQSMNTA